MTKLTDIGKKIKDTTEALAKADADLKWELAASAADVAGMIDPTPASDLIGAGLAVRKGDWLGAGMSLVSVVPYVGDALAKPAKAVRAAKRINELRETVTKLTAKLADLRKAEMQERSAKVAGKKSKQVAEKHRTTNTGISNKDCEACGPSSPAKQIGGKEGGGPKPLPEKTQGKKGKKGPCDHLRQGNGKGPYRGGAHSKTRKPANDGKDSHHMPADKISPLKRNDGPAIQMDPFDHKETQSNGQGGSAARSYRKMLENLLKEGKWRTAMAKEILDVRQISRETGNSRKYNEAMLEMLEYFKCLETHGLLK